MASITRLRTGLYGVLNAIPRLQTYGKLTENIELGDGGAAVVGPMGWVPAAMGQGQYNCDATVYLIVSAADYSVATDQLDELANPTGSRSVSQAIWNNPSLGVLDAAGLKDAHASVLGMSNYGGVLADAAGLDHIAAQLNLRILTSGEL
jgi:hypothetical protein